MPLRCDDSIRSTERQRVIPSATNIEKKTSQSRRREPRRYRKGLPSLPEKSRMPLEDTVLNDSEFKTTTKITKVDEGLGLVFGWLMICKTRDENGVLQKYYDTQGDHIPEAVMLEASADFMLNSRATKSMHEGDANGSAVFSWPVTEETEKAFGRPAPDQTGLMFCAKPPADVLEKFRSGEYTGFSIGGVHLSPPTPVD